MNGISTNYSNFLNSQKFFLDTQVKICKTEIRLLSKVTDYSSQLKTSELFHITKGILHDVLSLVLDCPKFFLHAVFVCKQNILDGATYSIRLKATALVNQLAIYLLLLKTMCAFTGAMPAVTYIHVQHCYNQLQSPIGDESSVVKQLENALEKNWFYALFSSYLTDFAEIQNQANTDKGLQGINPTASILAKHSILPLFILRIVAKIQDKYENSSIHVD